MPVYCISCEINRPTPETADVEDVIAALGTSTKPLGTVWLLRTNHTAEQVFDLVRRKLDASDRLFVVALSRPSERASWNLRPEVVAWLNTNL